MNQIGKIAVIRANSIGDFCFSIPALEALRAAYPQAEIVLLGRQWHYDFLKERPGPVDRVVVIPPYGGVSAEPGTREDTEAIKLFFRAMQAEHFDLALQLHGGGRYSNPFTLRLEAAATAGLRAPDAQPLDKAIPYVYFQHEVLRYLEVVALVGAGPVILEPVIHITDADRTELGFLGLAADEQLAVIHPGATDPRRRWPAGNFAAVGKKLVQSGATVAIIGSGEENILVHEVAEQMSVPSIELCDRLTLGGIAALLARSRIFVGNDSGPLHLAAAAGASTVGIFWCGNLINGGPFSRMRHRPVVSWRLTCPVCRRNTLSESCSHRDSFVADVPVDEVTANALDLWNASFFNLSSG